MAAEVLALIDLEGAERVLGIGCGDGRVTTERRHAAAKFMFQQKPY